MDSLDILINAGGLNVSINVGPNQVVKRTPALGRAYIYLSSFKGHLLSVRQKDGELGFADSRISASSRKV